MTTILVIEPHPILRIGILQVVSKVHPGVVAQGCDSPSSVRRSAYPDGIDLALISLTLPEQLLGLIELIQQACSPKFIMLLTDPDTTPHLMQGLPSTVSGYVSKNAPSEILDASVNLVLKGGTCFPLHPPLNEAQQRLAFKWHGNHAEDMAATARNTPQHAQKESEMLGLTPRQYEVLTLLARGLPMKTVSRYLNISVATVKAHAEAVYGRLRVRNRNAAVHAAVSRGASLHWTMPPLDRRKRNLPTHLARRATDHRHKP